MALIVQIGDYDGNAFKIRVDVDLVGFGGSWRAIDYGYIRYSNGKIERFSYTYDLLNIMVRLSGPDGKYGVQLDDWAPQWMGAGHLVNVQGEGIVKQPWVLKLKPGKITWARVDP